MFSLTKHLLLQKAKTFTVTGNSGGLKQCFQMFPNWNKIVKHTRDKNVVPTNMILRLATSLAVIM